VSFPTGTVVRAFTRLRGASGLDHSAAEVFATVWETVADVLGSATTAAIVRRAAGRAAARSPELVGLVIVREELEYSYRVPSTWSQGSERGLLSLRLLAAEMGRLLVEMTGNVVVQRLEEDPELRALGLVWREEAAN
jgi:hypothetical protein